LEIVRLLHRSRRQFQGHFVHEVTTPPPSPFAPYEPPPPAFAAVAFTGDRRAFINLVVRGAALGLVTFGFYRFWLATYVRRHLWSSTAVDGDAPEYTGTAIELLIGFLFALAILVPVYLLYFLAGLQAEIYQAFASLPLVVFLFLFAQFAIYRARRYRMTRTVWRGVRFWMRGSGWDYAWRAVLWSLLVAISFGAALPWRTAALERFKMRYSYYGNLQGHFEGTGRALFKEGWPFWLGTIFVVGIGTFIPPVLWIGGPFLYAFYKGIEWRWWVSGVRFGEVGFQSDLKMSALIDLYWKVIGWGALFAAIAGTIILIVGIAAVFAAGIDFSDAKQIPRMLEQRPYLTGGVLIVAGLLYLATILAIGVVTQIYLTRDLWQRVAATTTVYNLSAADNVIAQGDVASALGEGFADGLDVGGL
jgi:uncharacterized membrane protein YjgN (DUF898 family)